MNTAIIQLYKEEEAVILAKANYKDRQLHHIVRIFTIPIILKLPF